MLLLEGSSAIFLGILQVAMDLVQQKFRHRVAKQASLFCIQPGTVNLDE